MCLALSMSFSTEIFARKAHRYLHSSLPYPLELYNHGSAYDYTIMALCAYRTVLRGNSATTCEEAGRGHVPVLLSGGILGLQ